MAHLVQNLGIRSKLILGAAIIQIAILLTGALLYNEIVQSQERALALLRTTRVLNSTEALEALLSTMDVGARSYMLSGDDVLLEPYTQAYAKSLELRQRLREQVGLDPGQAEQLAELDLLVEEWRDDFLLPGIAQREQIGAEGRASQLGMTGRERAAKRAFDRLQLRISLFRTIELERVEQRERDAQAAAAGLRTTLVGCVALLALGSLGTFWALATNMARRVRRVTDAATRMAAGDLSARCDLVTSRDEVGQMAGAFNTMATALQGHADDLQVQYRAAEEARCELEQSHAQVVSQLATIERQQDMIRQMSVPVLPIDDKTLVMPLVGALDTVRLALVQERALQAIERSKAHRLILDVTGILVIDTQVAQGLHQVTQMAQLLGARVFIVGVRPEVAQALVGLGVDCSHFSTYASLQQGIAYLFGRSASQGGRHLFS